MTLINRVKLYARFQAGPLSRTYPAEFVLALGAGVHEGLSDDGQRGVHHFRHVDVEDEVGILQNVHPKTQRKAAAEGVESAVSREKSQHQINYGYADSSNERLNAGGLRFEKSSLRCNRVHYMVITGAARRLCSTCQYI